jgi:hypothetical protein
MTCKRQRHIFSKRNRRPEGAQRDCKLFAKSIPSCHGLPVNVEKGSLHWSVMNGTAAMADRRECAKASLYAISARFSDWSLISMRRSCSCTHFSVLCNSGTPALVSQPLPKVTSGKNPWSGDDGLPCICLKSLTPIHRQHFQGCKSIDLHCSRCAHFPDSI